MYFVTGAPPERQDYLTFIMPYDFYTWASTLASVAAVSIALIVINKLDSMRSQEPTNKSIFMSKYPSSYSLFSLKAFSKFVFSGIAFSFGAVFDEAQKVLVKKRTHKIIERSDSKAKILIILIWIICGYFLTLSYESVLRAMLMKTYYEKKIDTIDDVLATEREVFRLAETKIMTSDPRTKVRDLARKTKTYSQRDFSDLEWLVQGYLLMI